MPRDRFQCVDCGLRVEGRVNVLGEIKAYDASPSLPDSPVFDALCWMCWEKRREVED